MKTLTFKVTDDEERYIREQARKAGMTVSGFLRGRIRPVEAIEVVTSGATGAPSFSSRGESAPLTTEAVKGMLADFP